MYLIADDFEVCAPSTWTEPKTDIAEKLYILNSYYSLNPSKQPDIIFVDIGFENIADQLFFIGDYDISHLSNGKMIYTRKS